MAIQTRRNFLVASALTLGSFIVSTGLSGCQMEDTSGLVSFDHGVASGDPLHDRVILWTRITPVSEIESFVVHYEVATDYAFQFLVRERESALVSKENDYTLKVDFQNLDEDTEYFYRFIVGNVVSPVGRTKTLPVGRTPFVNFAVFSCANYPNGHFNVYEEASRLPHLDATIHLGDYIYEYGMYNSDGITPSYATEHAKEYGRELPDDNDKELLTLEDYRKRYALYHTDEGLQHLHQRAPMIVVWDDHEVANDIYRDGAANHNEDEGEFDKRRLAAFRAYFEWLPIRPVIEGNNEKIYRSFTFGNLVSLHMLDTRNIGRDKQIDYHDYAEILQDEYEGFEVALQDSNRSMLGLEQTNWLQTQLENSQTTWDVLGQQVIMGEMLLPAEIVKLIMRAEAAPESERQEMMGELVSLLGELYLLKIRLDLNDPTLSEKQKNRFKHLLPYNLDAWDGYAYNRSEILQTALRLEKNLVVLSGDTHNAWANELKVIDPENGEIAEVGVEFATASVSSPGMEKYANLDSLVKVKGFEMIIKKLIDNLDYFNASNRGFMYVTFTPLYVETEWVYVNNVSSKVYKREFKRCKKMKRFRKEVKLI